MPRPESPCGTHAAYKRHKRRKEPVDEACREAASEHVRAQRAREAERAAQNAAAVDEAAAGGTVRQLVAYGEFEEVTVPEHEEPLESARWRFAPEVGRAGRQPGRCPGRGRWRWR